METAEAVPGRTQAAALPAALENRAHERLARQLSPGAGAAGPHPERVSGLLSSGVSVNHAEVFLKPVLATSYLFFHTGFRFSSTARRPSWTSSRAMSWFR